MEAFFKYLKEKHIRQDFKSTFDLSAKFRLPGPSEQQKAQYFQDDFNGIFKRFYQFLRKNNTLKGKNDSEVEHFIKNDVDQSDLVMEFDTWLQQQGNQFTFVEKVEKPKSTHQTMPNYQAINSSYTSHNPPPQPKQQQQAVHPRSSNPEVKPTFIIQRPPYNVPPSPKQAPPLLNPVTQQKVAQKAAKFKEDPSLLNPNILSTTQMHYNNIPNPPKEEKQKPYRSRFIQKLSQCLDCPEKMNIVKAQLSTYLKKNN